MLVKDGRHLVGECAIIMPEEEKIIFAAGFYKIRVIGNDYGINTWNFAYALNNEKVKEQVGKLLFYSTVPHLSNRVKEIRLTFPKDKEELLKNSKIMKEILTRKFELRKQLRKIYTKN